MGRAASGCIGCGSYSQSIDPISAYCPRCKSRMRCHGSPKIKKPTLKDEIEKANLRVSCVCRIAEAERVFNSFMQSFASPCKSDKLRRLCWLHFIRLRTCDGVPLMVFRDSVVQSIAVNSYEANGGKIDERRKQYNYLLGRASVCPWNRLRQAAQGTAYDYQERRYLQSMPTLMHRAFDEIFIGAGIARFVSKINNEIRKHKDGTSR